MKHLKFLFMLVSLIGLSTVTFAGVEKPVKKIKKATAMVSAKPAEVLKKKPRAMLEFYVFVSVWTSSGIEPRCYLVSISNTMQITWQLSNNCPPGTGVANFAPINMEVLEDARALMKQAACDQLKSLPPDTDLPTCEQLHF